jgi:WD40 repeat protein
VRAAEEVVRSSRGYDAGKKVNGRKRHVAVAQVNGDVELWNPGTGRKIETLTAVPGAEGAIGENGNGVAFSPTGLLASADGNGAVQLWDTVSGLPLGSGITLPPDILVRYDPPGRSAEGERGRIR